MISLAYLRSAFLQCDMSDHTLYTLHKDLLPLYPPQKMGLFVAASWLQTSELSDPGRDFPGSPPTCSTPSILRSSNFLHQTRVTA
jgi:hypothetical protein